MTPQTFTLISIHGPSEFQSRLRALGLIPGAQFTRTQESTSFVVLQVSGSTFSLRQNDFQLLKFSQKPDGAHDG